jgi:hypothetical protein
MERKRDEEKNSAASSGIFVTFSKEPWNLQVNEMSSNESESIFKIKSTAERVSEKIKIKLRSFKFE